MLRIIVLAAVAGGLILAPALWLAYPRPPYGQAHRSAAVLQMAWALAAVNLFAALPSLCLVLAEYIESLILTVSGEITLDVFIDVIEMSELFAPILPLGMAALAIWAVVAIVLLFRDDWDGMTPGNLAATGGQDRQWWLPLALAAISLVIAGPQYLIEGARMAVSLLGCSPASRPMTTMLDTDWCGAFLALERLPVLSVSAVIWLGWAAFALWTAVALVMYLLPRKTLEQTGN
jgi:hypothetical protein